MSLLNAGFSKHGAMRLLLLLGTVCMLAMPAAAQKVKEGLTDLDKLAFTSPRFRMSETLADSDTIKNLIGFHGPTCKRRR